jgi:hypothetical protein
VPLFRWEYLRQPESNVPCAHFHIHAHRDEAVYLLLTGKGSNTRIKKRAAQLDANAQVVPQLSDLHFPVGGPRFRPSLEDVIQFLVEEFGIDCEAGWKDRSTRAASLAQTSNRSGCPRLPQRSGPGPRGPRLQDRAADGATSREQQDHPVRRPLSE